MLVGVPCANSHCVIPTALQAVQAIRTSGEPDATAFPPGPPGGLLTCFSFTQLGRVIDCSWINQASAAQVLFVGGYASTLADAAAKTRELQDAIDH